MSIILADPSTTIVGARKRRRFALTPYLYLLPAGAMLALFMGWPVIQSVYYSFLNWDGLAPATWAGLANYTALLADPAFWSAMRVTALWVLLSAGILPLTGLLMALLVEFGIRSTRMRAIARTVLFVPMTISLVAVGLLFSLFYNPVMGVLNNVLLSMGHLSELDLLGRSETALLAIFAVAVWQWTGFGMVLFSAALQGLPSELIDASRIDGASKMQTIRYIVIPLLMPTYFVITTIHMIGGFKAFDLIYVMTKGGPAGASETTSLFLYKQAFVLHDFGYASTVAVILLAVIGVVTVLFTRRRFSSN